MTDFGDTHWPKAAKDHRCIWCGETIPKGEKHAHFVGKWDGEFQDWRMHSECLASADQDDDLRDGFMPHEHERPRLQPEDNQINDQQEPVDAREPRVLGVR